MASLTHPKRITGTPEEIVAAVRELPQDHRYLVDIVCVDDEAVESGEALEEAIRRITSRAPEEIRSNREASAAASPAPRPLPPGKTLDDVVKGQWPGPETDKQILDALEELS